MKEKKKSSKLHSMEVGQFMADISSDLESCTEDVQASVQSMKKAKSNLVSHKEALENLKTKDPEFFKFLKDNDAELLAFDESEGELDDEDFDDDGKPDKLHVPPEELEVASDDSEIDEPDEEKTTVSAPKEQTSELQADESEGKIQVTMKMVKSWHKAVTMQPNSAILKHLSSALRAAVERSGGTVGATKYKVDDSVVFNAVVRLCFLQFSKALENLLANQDKTDPTKASLWKNLKSTVKSYLHDVLKLLNELQNSDVIAITLKHIIQMITYFGHFKKLSRILLLNLVKIWSSSEESCRVLAFVTLHKLVQGNQEFLLETCIKKLYFAYVQRTKLVSPDTWPVINFMQLSFGEMCRLDPSLTYQHAFIYIRQLAIHLRNAIVMKKKEMLQAVYNWQFVQCLYLWSRLISLLHSNESIQQLLYPLVQVTIGCAKLISAARYCPLRFHCCRILLQLSTPALTYVPVCSLILEGLELVNCSKKPTRQSFHPLNFNCLLKLSKSQLKETSFFESVTDQVVELLMTTMHQSASSISFPEIAVHCVIRLKIFIKKCAVVKYAEQLKVVAQKIQEHSNFIDEQVKAANLDLNNAENVREFESELKIDESSFIVYYNSWKKIFDRELRSKISAKNNIVDVDIQRVPRPKLLTDVKKRKLVESKSFTEIMEGEGDEDSLDDEERFLPPEKRHKQKSLINWSDSDLSDQDDSSTTKKLVESEVLKKRQLKTKKTNIAKQHKAMELPDKVEDLILSDNE